MFSLVKKRFVYDKMNLIIWLLKNVFGSLVMAFGFFLIFSELITNNFLRYFLGIIIIIIGFTFVDLEKKIQEFYRGKVEDKTEP